MGRSTLEPKVEGAEVAVGIDLGSWFVQYIPPGCDYPSVWETGISRFQVIAFIDKFCDVGDANTGEVRRVVAEDLDPCLRIVKPQAEKERAALHWIMANLAGGLDPFFEDGGIAMWAMWASPPAALTAPFGTDDADYVAVTRCNFEPNVLADGTPFGWSNVERIHLEGSVFTIHMGFHS